MIIPHLTINGRKASAKLLKNVKISIEIQDYIKGTKNKKQYEGIKFTDDKETIISF
jgi:hypothetical protein